MKRKYNKPISEIITFELEHYIVNGSIKRGYSIDNEEANDNNIILISK